MSLQSILATHIKKAFQELYNASIESVEFQSTRKDFEGDITVVTFPMLRAVKMNPAQLGEDLGNYLMANVSEIAGFNVVKGFLNLVISDTYFTEVFKRIYANDQFGIEIT